MCIRDRPKDWDESGPIEDFKKINQKQWVGPTFFIKKTEVKPIMRPPKEADTTPKEADNTGGSSSSTAPEPAANLGKAGDGGRSSRVGATMIALNGQPMLDDQMIQPCLQESEEWPSLYQDIEQAVSYTHLTLPTNREV